MAKFRGLVRGLSALAASVLLGTTASAQGLEAQPQLFQLLLPDLRIERAAIEPGRPVVRFDIVNLGSVPSVAVAEVTVFSRLSRRQGRLRIPPLAAGERRSLSIALPVDPALLPPGARPDGTRVTLEIHYPAPERDRNNRFAFVIGGQPAQPRPPAAIMVPRAPSAPGTVPTAPQTAPRAPEPPPATVTAPARPARTTLAPLGPPPRAKLGPLAGSLLAALMPRPALGPAFGGILADGARLYLKSGDFELPPNTNVAPDDQNQTVWFNYDVAKVPNAEAVVWQVSRVPFAPVTSPNSDPFDPRGLLLTRPAPHRVSSFKVNFAPLAEELGLKHKPIRARARQGTTVFGTAPRLPPGGAGSSRTVTGPLALAPGAGTRISTRAPGSRSGSLQVTALGPRTLNFVARGGRLPFYVRVLPVTGEGEPRLVGKPSNVGEVLYGLRPPQENPFAGVQWVPNPRPAPRLALTEVVYKPYRWDHRWPPGCTVYRGRGKQMTPWDFLLSLWDWASETFGKVKGWAVDFVVAVLPILPRGVVDVALDGALVAAGIPPDIPNLDELIDEGAGYLAKAAAEQVVGPAVGELTDDLAAELLGPSVAAAVAQQGPDALKRRVQEETEKRIKGSLKDSANKLRAEIQDKAEETRCTVKEYTPIVKLTVRNLGGERYDDITVGFSFNNFVFKGHGFTFDLAPHETVTLATALYPDLWRTAGEYHVRLYDAMDKHYEVYNTIPGRLSVSGPGEPTGCYVWPDGTVNPMFGCTYDDAPDSPKRGLQYSTPNRTWNEAFTQRF